MAHLRPRFSRPALLKLLKLWPVLNIFGPRQSGKSTLLRELMWRPGEFSFVSLDRVNSRESAQSNPELFLSGFDHEPLVIDEAHKAPALFDEIKAEVDERKRPGRFILTGSIGFSKKIGIKESLTGRSAIYRMDSLTLSETLGDKTSPDLKAVTRYFKMGGMPGVCFLHDQSQILNYWDEWLETVSTRDLHEYSKGRLSPSLAINILKQCAILERPTQNEIAKKLRVDSRKVRGHIDALKELFLIRSWSPYQNKEGKEQFLIFDCGLATFLGADHQRVFQIFLAHQLLNRNRFNGKKDPQIFYERTHAGSFVDLIFEEKFYIYCPDAFPSKRFLLSLKAVEARHPKADIFVCVGTDAQKSKLTNRSALVSWASFF